MVPYRLTRRLRLSYSPDAPGWQIAGAVVLGMVIGGVSALFSVWWVLGGLLAGLCVPLVLKRPELGLLGILVCTSSIIYENQLPLIPIGVGSLHIPDLILLALLGLIVLRAILEPGFRLIRTPLDLPLLAFYGMTLVATACAMLYSGLNFNLALRGIRGTTYYLTFFVVTNLVRDQRQLRLLLNGIFLLGALVAGVMILQYLLGTSLVILPGRVETLSTEYVVYKDITRILPPGQSLILLGLLGTAFTLILEPVRPHLAFKAIQTALLGLAVLLTFNRNFWITVLLAFGVLALVLRGEDRRRASRWVAVFVVGSGLLLFVLLTTPRSQTANLLNASFQRLNTLLSRDVVNDSSLRWRDREYEYAIPQVLAHPILGLGAGASYRPLDPRMDWEGFDGRAYIHNGHVWIMLQSGLPGYGFLLLLSLMFLARGFLWWKRMPTPFERGVILSLTLVYLGGLLGNIVSPMFTQWFWTPLFGIMMGSCEILIRWARQAAPQAAPVQDTPRRAVKAAPVPRPAAGTPAAVVCPACQATSRQFKAGYTRAGVQRYRCRRCGCTYTAALNRLQPGDQNPASGMAE